MRASYSDLELISVEFLRMRETEDKTKFLFKCIDCCAIHDSIYPLHARKGAGLLPCFMEVNFTHKLDFNPFFVLDFFIFIYDPCPISISAESSLGRVQNLTLSFQSYLRIKF